MAQDHPTYPSDDPEIYLKIIQQVAVSQDERWIVCPGSANSWKYNQVDARPNTWSVQLT